MRPHEEDNATPAQDRFARLDALYEAFCHSARDGASPGEDAGERVVEVPCELAPGVRRRITKRTH